jgi:NADH dehydrogenase FAD-containing subunit
MRIVVHGGGFGGVTIVKHLERILRRRAVGRVFGLRLTGFVAWFVRRTYYLFQMPRWEQRLRIVLDWTVALFFRPDITPVDLCMEREQVRQARQLVEKSSKVVRRTQT